MLSLNGPIVLNGIEWYYKLQLRIPLSPTEIPLNDPTVLNGIQWYTIGSFLSGPLVALL